MFKKITIQRVSTGTLFKLLGLGLGLSFVIFTSLMGCFALFGFNTVRLNQQALTGVTGLLISPFMGLLIAAAFTAFLGTFMALGLWLYSKFRPLTLWVKVVDTEAEA